MGMKSSWTTRLTRHEGICIGKQLWLLSGLIKLSHKQHTNVSVSIFCSFLYNLVCGKGIQLFRTTKKDAALKANRLEPNHKQRCVLETVHVHCNMTPRRLNRVSPHLTNSQFPHHLTYGPRLPLTEVRETPHYTRNTIPSI